jgi:hypothetical protein
MVWWQHVLVSREHRYQTTVTWTGNLGEGTMAEGGDGGGEFTGVTLRPRATFADSGQASRALGLHEEAHRLCFIARSVNFPVGCEPVITA